MLKRLSYFLLIIMAMANVSLAQNRDANNILNAQFDVRVSQGPKGTKVIEMRIIANTLEEAHEIAQRDAVAVCLLRGLPASTKTRPMPAIVKESVIQSNESYFIDFLKIPSSKKVVGKYARYVAKSWEADVKELDYGVDAVIDVQVLYDNLLQYMQDKGYSVKPTETIAGKYLKPVIMVVPADVYCTEMDFVQKWKDETGKVQTISDYNIFGREESRDLRLVISSLNEIFASRGFETISLEFLLKSLSMETDENAFIGKDYGLSGTVKESPLDRIKRTANVDFIVDLDFALYEIDDYRYVAFNMRAVDPCSNAVEIAHAYGDGRPSRVATINTLLEEAVINYVDDFCDKIQNHYNKMETEGHRITVKVKKTDKSKYDFQKSKFEYEGKQTKLCDIIYYWLQDHTIDNNPTRNITPNVLSFSQVMIPMITKNKHDAIRRLDSNEYVTQLQEFLSNEYNIESTIYMRGPGEAWLIL
ncbi:MAG: hypothetical protein IJK92_08240 [Bacteroidales bacterium]|nr:hypothetical protein [Bacteroidales bacterium]